ncbi:MAG: FGGY-family carbohydrate kinase, partial [Anaerolineae bacterium]
MSLLGIDVGTTGCKAAAFSEEGALIASAYEEYDLHRPQPGWAELDTVYVWDRIQATIRRVTAATSFDPIQALAVSSLGEAMVPVTADRRIVGPSIVANFDLRGEEYLEPLQADLDEQALYRITGNTLGRNYSLPKLLWIQNRQPDLYRATDMFLLWGGLVAYLLGASPVVDYSLANRTLLFDVDRGRWSQEILDLAGLDVAKLPATVPSGTAIGTVSPAVASELGLPRGVTVV